MSLYQKPNALSAMYNYSGLQYPWLVGGSEMNWWENGLVSTDPHRDCTRGVIESARGKPDSPQKAKSPLLTLDYLWHDCFQK
jgi:beta-galactosidase/beta-glucuronidase